MCDRTMTVNPGRVATVLRCAMQAAPQSQLQQENYILAVSCDAKRRLLRDCNSAGFCCGKGRWIRSGGRSKGRGMDAHSHATDRPVIDPNTASEPANRPSGHGHHHGHANGHDHGHGHHHHAPASFGVAFAVGVVLNLGFVIAEAGFGFVAGSMALVADAGHNLTDVAALLIAWAARVAAGRPSSARFTYGFKSGSILAALGNTALLLVAVGAILVETVRRFAEPAPVAGGTVMVVAAIGIAINGITALLFARGREHDINLRAAFVHMAADAAVSAGVVLAGLLVLLTGWRWIDPAASLAIVAVIAISSWRLLVDSVRLGLNGVPPGIDLAAVRAFLCGQPGVATLHDLHVWPMSTTETALTAHLAMPGGHPGDAFLAELAHELEHRFGIGHATMQVELTPGDCGAGC